jgi:hypothetical protein
VTPNPDICLLLLYTPPPFIITGLTIYLLLKSLEPLLPGRLPVVTPGFSPVGLPLGCNRH